MSPDAELRMRVYQEGQRAYNAGTSCPYKDWRAGTWAKGRAAAHAFHTQMPEETPQTLFPMNVYLRDEAELRAFIEEHKGE